VDVDVDVDVDGNGLEVLSRQECLRLVSGVTLGRVGVSSGALPTVLPVNFWLDGERILIRTGPGSKLEAALRNAVVAFEVDHFDDGERAGWSVIVTGVATAVPAAEPELEHGANHWGPRGGGHVVAISTERISGRRIRDREPEGNET
jgi:hypothetical protein